MHLWRPRTSSGSTAGLSYGHLTRGRSSSWPLTVGLRSASWVSTGPLRRTTSKRRTGQWSVVGGPWCGLCLPLGRPRRLELHPLPIPPGGPCLVFGPTPGSNVRSCERRSPFTTASSATVGHRRPPSAALRRAARELKPRPPLTGRLPGPVTRTWITHPRPMRNSSARPTR